MYLFKQMLCRWLFMLSWGVSCLLAWGAVADAMAKTKAERSSPPAAEISPQDALQQSVKKWVSEQQKTPAEFLQVAPLDARLKLQACAVPLMMDTPFSSAETVRVRCSQPVWQLYVKVVNAARPLSSVALSQRDPVAGKAIQRKVLVAATVLPRGTVLNETHVVLAEVDTSGIGSPAYESVAEVMHSELIRDLRPGQPIRVQDVRPTVLVKRGQMVLLSVGQSQGFQITARVEALQDGRMGEQVQLRNKESGKILTGVVKGPNAVQAY